MIDHIGRVNMDYMVRMARDPAWVAGEQKLMEAHNVQEGATFHGKPIPVTLKPHFISNKQRRVIISALNGIQSALNKFIHYWLDSPELQRMWGASPEVLELYAVDPGYSDFVQVARHDALMDKYTLKFLEFNCDSPGGTGYADVIHHGFLAMFDRNDMGARYSVSRRQRVQDLAAALSACYAEWRAKTHPNRPERPFVVVSDWEDVATRPDIDITIRGFVEAGLDVAFADPGDLALKGSDLYLGDRRVDVLYKRVILRELLEKPETNAMVEAYKAGTICLVNSPRSVIVGNKKTLAALRRPEVLALLTNEERRVVRDHIPWTEVLRDEKVDFQGFTVNLRDFVADNKDKLVLKSSQGYGGKEVVLGFETDPEEWRRLLARELHSNEWIVQELVTIPRELFPQLRDGGVHMELLNVNINPLSFGGKYAGSFSRISEKAVINVSYGGGLLPTMTVEPMEEP